MIASLDSLIGEVRQDFSNATEFRWSIIALKALISELEIFLINRDDQLTFSDNKVRSMTAAAVGRYIYLILRSKAERLEEVVEKMCKKDAEADLFLHFSWTTDIYLSYLTVQGF